MLPLLSIIATLLQLLLSPAQAADSTTAAAAVATTNVFPTCDTGSSRLLLANLDHLPAQCKPGHRPLAAAVFECFASSRVVVHKCRTILLPGRPSSRAGLDCRVMHAQGTLTGPANATLVGVLDGPKAAALLQPGNKLYQGLDTVKLQQQLVQAMQMLFGQVIVTKPSNTTTGSVGGTKQTAAGAAAQPGQAGNSTAAAAGSGTEGSGEHPKTRRHHPRKRPRQHSPEQQPQQQGSSASIPGSQQHTGHGKWRHRGPHGTMPGPAATDAGNSSSISASINSTGTPTPAAGSTGASVNSSVAGTSGGAQSSQPPGRRSLNNDAKAAGTPAAAADNVGDGVGNVTEAAADADSAAASEAEVQEAADEAAAATAAGSTAKGAVLYRQDRSIIVRPTSSCKYQFMVTRNPSFLQPDLQLAAQPGIRGPRKRSKSSSWWVSAGALFAGVSAVLALAVCLMSAHIWSRYKSYEALPSEPAPLDAQQHNGHQAAFEDMGPSSLFPSALPTALTDQLTRNVPDMGVELQQTRGKSQAGIDDDHASQQDQQR